MINFQSQANAYLNRQWLPNDAQSQNWFAYTQSMTENLRQPGDPPPVHPSAPWAARQLWERYQQWSQRDHAEAYSPASQERQAANARAAQQRERFNRFNEALQWLQYLRFNHQIDDAICAALELEPGDLAPLVINPKYDAPEPDSWEPRSWRVISAAEQWRDFSPVERTAFAQKAAAADLRRAVTELQSKQMEKQTNVVQ